MRASAFLQLLREPASVQLRRRPSLLLSAGLTALRSFSSTGTRTAPWHPSPSRKHAHQSPQPPQGLRLPSSTAEEGERLLPASDAELPADLTTTNATDVDFARDIYGPWLVMTEDLHGELFVDHDAFVFYRPSASLGYGVGRLEVIDAKQSGTVFTLKLETYVYEQKTTFAPRAGITLEVTGMVKLVRSAATAYQTFSLIGIYRKDDPNRRASSSFAGQSLEESTTALGDDDADDELITGQFNAAKLSPWAPTEKDMPWQPNKELQHIFKEVFPQELKLTSHIERRRALERRNEASNKESADTTSSITTTATELGDRVLTPPLHLDLEKYRVGGLPDIYYIPDYVNELEEEQILAFVKNTPAELKSRVTKRTVQEWGCTMCAECEKSFVSDVNMPPWVQACTDMLISDGIFTPSTFPNSVRIHEYERGEGIGPHCDGPIYVPCVTVLSLAATSVMSFYPRQEPYFDKPMEHYNDTFKFAKGTIGANKPVQTIVLEPRSLLVFAGDAYYYHPHGVSDKEVDDLSPEAAGEVVNRHLLRDGAVTAVERKYRVSLTTRNLLTRCNHQSARAELCMKRAWYLYNQLPVPEPLFTAPPIPYAVAAAKGAPTGAMVSASTSSSPLSASASHNSSAPLSAPELQAWEQKLDRVLAEQQEIRRCIEELKELVTLSVSAEAQFRKDASSILNNITTTILNVDAKVEDLRDELEERNKEC